MIAATARMDQIDAVVAYENAALFLFERARAKGIMTILDAASIHHTRQDALRPFAERTAFHASATARKDCEVAFADVVLTCSCMARDTYVNAGIPTKKLRVVTLGADIQTGHDADSPSKAAPIGPTRLLFVGRLTRHKGIDLLLDALEVVRAAGKVFEATIVADVTGVEASLVTRARRVAALQGTMPRAELNRLYAKSDCLILPSRFDSFGLVVPEALVQGCCAVVSDGAGASTLVADSDNGLVVPMGDADALAQALCAIISDIEKWRSRRDAISVAAARFDWRHYRQTVSDLIGQLVSDHLHEKRA